ncbi:3-(3-hydroxy-phenyl)propionate hydroxylase [Halopseudomonas sabulinigri]|uniref:3-(3-hydroxy-phenyl)propionate hydroxylase n=1 Tax=Halopseudomonas sabulinigri TaxID=472181 RepID=A0A1H1VN12_9GAMM|nr:bifunctional 3-(3-hydroxy-phenyl)propionate/3-hydroxycinnamic acid hydroxylase [Halopseudomonas sabulinigri]SDS86334.1 3-(3-hydroxy-phenyl)propionate hydroxylase [Halopseudomonas sabulinigri]
MNNKNSAPLPTSVDVLLVGNGPVGAGMATLLGRLGINTLVIDKVHDVLLMPRAIALDNEALRILQQMGLSEDAFERIVIPQVRMHCPMLGEFSRANTSGSLDGHPKLVTFYQPDLEHALRARYASYDCVRPATGLELLDLQQQAKGVLARMRDENGIEHQLEARFVVGADGASSLVRSLIGQDFEGESYSENWLIVDARGREGKAIDHVEFLCDHRRPTPHMPAPGGRERWEFMLRDGEDQAYMESSEQVAKLLARWIPADQLQIERKAVYRFHARCCSAFSKGDIFLIGDAAHITPPFVGQGLVAGLRDAANLAWKLAWVLQGRVARSILDSYDQERRPHAHEMINLAKFMGKLVMPRTVPAAILSHGMMKLMRTIPAARRRFEEMEIKPKNVFKQGLFIPAKQRGQLICGGLFPQAGVRLSTGDIALSDSLLDDQLTLVGFQSDPARHLGPSLRRRWEQMGGGFVQLARQNDSCARTGTGTGTGTGTMVAQAPQSLLDKAPEGMLCVVRPDRIIMACAEDGDANRLLSSCLRQLETE